MEFPRIGTEFAGYRIEGVLGRGGMSVVFRAENLSLGNTVALKFMSLDVAEDDRFRERFVRESRIAASLSHPNVIPIFAAGDYEGLLYIAMRYVAGPDLKTLIRQKGPMALPRVVTILGQVAGALDEAHDRGLIHRDVKPANVLTEPRSFDDPDHVFLSDFGVTKHQLSRSGLTGTGQFIGTVDYVSPEQARGDQIDHRSDNYSLGCVLYECLTGVVPFNKDEDYAVLLAHLQEEPRPVSGFRAGLPHEIDAVVSKALAKAPDDRYQSCRELATAFREAAGIAPAPADVRTGAAAAPPRAPQTVLAAGAASASAPPAAGAASATAAPAPSADVAASPPPGADVAAPPPGRPPNRSVWLSPVLVVLGALLLGAVLASAAFLATRGEGGGAKAPTTVTAPGSGEGPALTGLELVVPGPAWRRCSAVPARAGALETVSCQPSGQADVTYQISGYRNTDELRAAYRRIVHDAGLKPNTDGCTSAHLEGETTWTHSATGALGGHEACFFDRASGDSVIAWTHMRTNVPGEPPQADHRDVLGVARQHSELPNALFTWWGFWHEHIGKLRGT